MRRAVFVHALTAIALAMFGYIGGCASAPPSGNDVAAPTLRIMSFNIRMGTAPDGVDDWPHRRALASDAVREFTPQLLALQEALRFQLDQLRADLPGYDEIGVGRDDGRQAGEYSAILYDRRRLELLDQGTFWFSDTPATPGSMSWGNHYPRLCSWGYFRDRASDRRFHLYNLHWDHESQASRERSAALLLERIAGRGSETPVLVTGDFNAGEDNPAFRALLNDPRVPLADSFRTRHPDRTATGTFHGFRGTHDGPRIDAILTGPEWEIRDADIVAYARRGRYPSDHFPVTAIVRATSLPTPHRRP